jgi:uncharacterized repeat protein (TIGR02543 family)
MNTNKIICAFFFFSLLITYTAAASQAGSSPLNLINYTGSGYYRLNGRYQFLSNLNYTTYRATTESTAALIYHNLFVSSSPSSGGSVSPGTGSYTPGSNVTLSETPNSGYTFTGWTCSGTNCYSGTSASATVMVSKNIITEVANYVLVGQQGTNTVQNKGQFHNYISDRYNPRQINSSTPSKITGHIKTFLLGNQSAISYNSIVSPCNSKQKYNSGAKYTVGIYNCPRVSVTPGVNVQSNKKVAIKSASSETTNWAGWASNDTAAVANSVQGSWIVQTASPSTNTTYSTQWIGIGGLTDNTLIQTGTESDYYNGTASYIAWYELVPAAETPLVGFTVSPGDRISANITQGTAPNAWIITLTDLTMQQAFMITVTYNSPKLSSEWIDEQPDTCLSSSSCVYSSLSNFGTAYYGSDYTSEAGTNYANMGSGSQPLSELPNITSITMVNVSSTGALTELAQPSALTTDGTSFTVTKLATYAVNSSASPSSGGTVTGSGIYDSGSSATISEIPNAGYTFTGWTCTGSGCYSGSSTNATFTPSTSVTEQANFVPVSTTSTQPQLPSGMTNVTLTETPSAAATYWSVCATWMGPGANKINESGSTCIEPYVSSNDVIIGPPATTTKTAAIPIGAVIYYVCAIPATTVTINGVATNGQTGGYSFLGWSGSYNSAASCQDLQPPFLNVTGPTTLQANFQSSSTPSYYPFTVSSSPSAGGITTIYTAGMASGASSAIAGSLIRVSATPKPGYTFAGWTCTGNLGAVSVCPSGTQSSFNFTITGSTTITANFQPLSSGMTTFTLKENPASASNYWIACFQYTAPNGMKGPVPCEDYYGGISAAIYTLPIGSKVNVLCTMPGTAAGTGGYQFSSWSGTYSSSTDNCTGIYNPASNPTLFTVIGPTIITANYVHAQAPYTINITINDGCSGCSGSVVSNSGGSVDSGPANYNYGARAQFSEIPGQGYVFTGWTCTGPGCPAAPEGSSQTSPIWSFNVTGSATVTGNFQSTSPTTTLKIQISPSDAANYWGACGGYIVPSGIQTQSSFCVDNIQEPNPYTAIVPIGTRLTALYTGPLTNKGGGGYSFENWSGSYSSTSSAIGNLAKGNLLTINGPTTIQANYVHASNSVYYNLTVSSSPVSGGEVSPCSYCSGGSSVHLKGTSVTLSEIPYTGYTFTGWTGTGQGSYTGTSSSATVIVNNNMTETANFQHTTPAANYYTLKISANPINVGYVATNISNASANLRVVYCKGAGLPLPSAVFPGLNLGSTYQLCQMPNIVGYTFKNWTGTGTGSYTGTTANPIITMGSNVTEVANFQNTYSVPGGLTGCLPAAAGIYATASANPTVGGTVSIDGIVSGGPECSDVPHKVSETPAPGYTFTGWTCLDVGCPLPSNTTTSFETAIGAPATITANFQQATTSIYYNVNAYSNPIAGGSVNNAGKFIKGTTASLSETPNYGYAFTGWTCTGNVICPTGTQGTQSSFSFIVTGNVSVTANFRVLPSYTVKIYANPSNGGSVNFNTFYLQNGSVSYGQTGQLTETPASGYVFTGWTGTGNESYTGSLPSPGIIVYGNIVETANFQKSSNTCQVYRPNGPGTTTFINTEGVCNNAQPQYVAQFNGKSSVVNISNTPSTTLTGNTMTVTGWIYTNNVSTIYNIQTSHPPMSQEYFGSWSGVGDDWIFDMYISAFGGYPTLEIANTSNAHFSVSGTRALSPKTWYFLTDSLNGKTMSIYVNGVLVTSSNNFVGTLLPFSTGACQYSIGAKECGGSLKFNGLISNIQIYNTSFTPSQILQLYYKGIGGDPLVLNSLVGWWPLNGNANDYSGNLNNGVSTNLVYNSTWSSEYLVQQSNPGYYNIIVSSSPSNGGNVYPCFICGGSTAAFLKGTNITILETPNLGYTFKNWTCTGTGCYSGTNTNPLITMNGNITETANYQISPNPTVILCTSANPQNAGAGWQDMPNAVDGCRPYPYGTVDGLFGQAADGYVFTNWTCTGAGCNNGGYSGVNARPNVTLIGNLNETANFKAVSTPYTITVVINDGCNGCSGSIASGGPTMYNYGARAGFSARAAPGYVFTGWSCSGIGCPAVPLAPSQPFPIISAWSFNVTGSAVVTANFMASTTTTLYSLITHANPSTGGEVNNWGNYTKGSIATISESPMGGYNFTGWTCTGAGCYSGASAVAKITMNNNITETANFKATPSLYGYSENTNPAGAGIVTPPSWQYAPGTQITLSETPNSGYTFKNWTCTGAGCYAGTATSPTITINNGILETANYQVTSTSPANTTLAINETPSAAAKNWGACVAWTTLAGATGQICAGPSVFGGQGTSASATVPIGTLVTDLYAEPWTNNGGGYSFTDWSGAYSSTISAPGYSAHLLAAGITEPTTITANFQSPSISPLNITYTVTASPSTSGTGVVNGGEIYQSGSIATISQTPIGTNTFTGWTCSGSVTCPTGTSTTSFSFNVIGNATIIANYQAASSSNAPTTYIVTASANPSGYGVVTGSGTYSSNQLANIIEVSIGTNTFTGWTCNGSAAAACSAAGTSTVLDFPVTGPATVTANYQLSPTPYPFTASASPSAGGTVYPGSGSYLKGTNVTISEIPNPGYTFTGWTGTGAGSYTGPGPSNTVTMTNNAITETANFQIGQYALTVNNNGCTSVSGSGNYNYGSSATFSVVVPTTGNTVFSGWSGTGTGSYNENATSHSVTMDNPITETATCITFSPSKIILTEYPYPTGAGTVTPGTGSYAPGTQVTITETPAAPGYVFENWTGEAYLYNSLANNGLGAFSWTENGTGSYSGTSTSHSLTINTAPGISSSSGPVEIAMYKVMLTVNNNGCTSPTGGGLYNYGSTVPFSIVVPNGYTFYGWTGTGPSSYTGQANSLFVIMSNPITETATCTPPSRYAFTESTNPPGAGTVTPGSGTYTAGSAVTLSESSNPGYTFTGWTGTGKGNYTTGGPFIGTVTSPTIIVNNPITEVANYQSTAPASTTLTLQESYSPSDAANDWGACLAWTTPAGATGQICAGHTLGSSNTTTVPVGTSVTAMWTNPWTNNGGGYAFSSWSGPGFTGLTGSDLINKVFATVNGPTTITANYQSAYYTLTETAKPAGTGAVGCSNCNSGGTSLSCTSGCSFTVLLPAGQQVALSETPNTNAGYYFGNWAGTGAGSYTGTATSSTITINGDITENATFLGYTSPESNGGGGEGQP